MGGLPGPRTTTKKSQNDKKSEKPKGKKKRERKREIASGWAARDIISSCHDKASGISGRAPIVGGVYMVIIWDF